MMKRLICVWWVFAASFPTFASGKIQEIKNQDATFEDRDLGVIRYRAKYIGEPIGQPTEFEVSVICPRQKKTKVIRKWSSCVPVSHEYDKVGKVLTIKHLKGRTHKNGSSDCDQEELEEINLSKSCK